MATLTSKTPANTYKDLLKIASTSDNLGITSSLLVVEDGDATASSLSLSTVAAKITGALEVTALSTLANVAIASGTITGITDLAVADGGTGASTAATALNNLLPSQTSAASKYLQSDGTNASWDAVTLSTADITGTLAVANGGTGITSFGTGVATFLGTPSSANLAAVLTDETGTGALVFASSPTLVTPNLGTPSTLIGTNISGTATSFTSSNVTTNANLTGHITSTGNAAILGSFTVAQLSAAISDQDLSGTNTGDNAGVTSVSGTSPIVSSGGTTPAISIAAASASNSGALSNTDWSTFNSKQSAITLTTTGTSGASTLSSGTLNIPNYAPDLSGYLPLVGGTMTGDILLTNKEIKLKNNFYIKGKDIGDATYYKLIGLDVSDEVSIDPQGRGAAFGGTLSVLTGATIGGTLGVTGNATFDTNVLFVDAANDRVGIGTTGPGTNTRLGVVGGALDISASSSASDASLHIKTSYGGYDRLTQIAPTGASKPGLNLLASTDGASTNQWWVWGVTSGNIWRIQDGTSFSGSEGLSIDSAGNVGIGTDTPTAPLNIVRTAVSGENGLRVVLTQSYGADSSTNALGISGDSLITGAGDYSNTIAAVAINGSAQHQGTGVVNGVMSGRFVSRNTSSGTVTNLYGINILNIVNNGTITNAYGVYVGDYSTGNQTNIPFSFYASDPNAYNYFAGNVGIGTTAPGQKLTVSTGASSGYINLIGQNRNLYLGQDSTGASIYSDGDVPMYFSTNGTEKVRITSSGNVGIGTTAPFSKLLVVGTSKGASLSVGPAPSTGNYVDIYGNAANGGTVHIGTNYWVTDGSLALGTYTTPDVMTLTTTGNVGIGTSSPSTLLHLSTANASNALKLTSTTGTNASYMSFSNTGGNAYVGRESSAGNNLGSVSLPYALALVTESAYPIEFVTNNVTRAIIDSAGNVGIGTTTPGQKLDVAGNIVVGWAQGNRIGMDYSDGAEHRLGLSLYGNERATNIDALSADFSVITFRTGTVSTPAEKMRITYTGNVGIGETSPSEKLHVNGFIKTSAPTSGTSGSWKLGVAVTTTSQVIKSTQYIQVDIGGTLYRLAIAETAV